MEQSLHTHRASNITKTWFLLALFFGLILGVGYVLSVFLNAPGIFVSAGILSLFTSVGSYWFSDAIALKMAGTRIIDRATHKDLYDIVDNLSIAAGMPTPKIGVIDDPALNAFATGRSPKKGVVVFTTGLIDSLTTEELQGVAAHEMSHIANRDVLIGTIAMVLTSVVALAGRMMHLGGGRGNSRNNAVVLIIGFAIVAVASLFAMLLRMALSRKREFLADTTGAMLTGNPKGLASALQKIGSRTKPLDRAHASTAHLFISNPFGGNAKKLSHLFSTHPPIKERVERLLGADKYGEV